MIRDRCRCGPSDHCGPSGRCDANRRYNALDLVRTLTPAAPGKLPVLTSKFLLRTWFSFYLPSPFQSPVPNNRWSEQDVALPINNHRAKGEVRFINRLTATWSFQMDACTRLSIAHTSSGAWPIRAGSTSGAGRAGEILSRRKLSLWAVTASRRLIQTAPSKMARCISFPRSLRVVHRASQRRQ